MNVANTDFDYVTCAVRDAVKGVMTNPSKNITEVCKKWEKDDLQNMPLEDLFRGLRTIYSNAAHFLIVDLPKGEVYNIDGDRIFEKVEVMQLLTSLPSDMGATAQKVQSVVDSKLQNESTSRIINALDLIRKLQSIFNSSKNMLVKIMKGEVSACEADVQEVDKIGKEVADSLMKLEEPLTDDFKSQERF